MNIGNAFSNCINNYRIYQSYKWIIISINMFYVIFSFLNNLYITTFIKII